MPATNTVRGRSAPHYRKTGPEMPVDTSTEEKDSTHRTRRAHEPVVSIWTPYDLRTYRNQTHSCSRMATSMVDHADQQVTGPTLFRLFPCRRNITSAYRCIVFSRSMSATQSFHARYAYHTFLIHMKRYIHHAPTSKWGCSPSPQHATYL